ncbi:hypothetical protein D3C83_137600 [compost metagenome]
MTLAKKTPTWITIANRFARFGPKPFERKAIRSASCRYGIDQPPRKSAVTSPPMITTCRNSPIM